MNAPITTPVAAKAASKNTRSAPPLSQVAWHGAGSDRVITDAFARWQAAHRERSALPDGKDIVEREKPFWNISDAAEELIRSTHATTPAGIAAKLWIALEHEMALQAESRLARDADLSAFADDSGQDWTVRLILSALRSLEALGRDDALSSEGSSRAWSDAWARFVQARRDYDAYSTEVFEPAWEAQEAFERSRGFVHDAADPASVKSYVVRRDKFQDTHGTAHCVPDEMHKQIEHLSEALSDAAGALLNTPAPDLAALRWKLDYLTDGLTDWGPWGGMTQVFADIARLLPAVEAKGEE